MYVSGQSLGDFLPWPLAGSVRNVGVGPPRPRAVDFDALAVGPDPQIPLASFERRRARVAKALGDEAVLVVATNPVTTYSNDVEHVFRPHSDFWYLTGFREPHALLVLEGGSGATTLFLQGRKPEAEVWTGKRLGVERACEALAVDRAYDIEGVGARLREALRGRKVHAVVGHDGEVATRLAAATGEVQDARPLLADMRLRKDAEELAMLARAADVGVEAMRRAARQVRPGHHEFQVEAELLRTYREHGSTGPGYPPIVGAGANAAVLHYIANTAPIREGDMVLVDAGCEWGYYNSDITRTFPAGDPGDDAWRVYDLVVQAHDAAVRAAVPGNRLRDPHDAAVRVLAEGLAGMGLLAGDADKVVEDGGFRSFFMHGTSHYLGLDVHDVGTTKDEEGKSRRLEEGMVITVEPGLYFNTDFAKCPDHLAGLGVRVEDDVVVTADGPRVLTASLPRQRDEVEALVGVLA